jgi:hypothetical protein
LRSEIPSDDTKLAETLNAKIQAEHSRLAEKIESNNKRLPIPVAARSKAWVCGRSPADIVGSNPTEGMDVCLL